MKTSYSENFVNFLLLGLLPISIMLHAFWLPHSISVTAISDSGYVSIITLTFLACSFVTLLTLVFNTHFAASKWAAATAAYAVAIYFSREADLHRLLTVEHVTRPKFYSMESVPIWQKLIAASIFLILTICILYLLIKFARTFWQKLRSHEPWSIALFLWFTVLFMSQLCDKTGLNDTHLGRVIEENSECWASIFLFLTIVQLIPTLELRKQNNFSEQIIPHQ